MKAQVCETCALILSKVLRSFLSLIVILVIRFLLVYFFAIVIYNNKSI